MISVNLLNKKRSAAKVRNWVLISIYVLLGAAFLYFLSQTVYVIWNNWYLSSRIVKVKQESESLSSEILKNDKKMYELVMSKQILEKYALLKSQIFRYKDYLDGVNIYLPAGATLQGVDFSEKGVVKVSIGCENSIAFKELESNLNNFDKVDQDPYFNQIAIEQVSRDDKGVFVVKLLFGLKS